MNYEPWPPPRNKRYESYSERQLLQWLELPLDAQAKARLREAMQTHRTDQSKIFEQQNRFVARTVKKAKRRRSADPPQPSNRVVARHGILGGVGSGISLGSVLVGLDVYEKVKGTGIVWDLVWLLSQIGKVELGLGEWVGLFLVTGIGCFVAALWKLVK